MESTLGVAITPGTDELPRLSEPFEFLHVHELVAQTPVE